MKHLLLLVIILFLSAIQVWSAGVEIHWTKALDDVSPQVVLTYELRQSYFSNIATLQDAETNGKIVMRYTPNVDQFAVMNLSQRTTYYFTVIVSDEAGNKAVYRMVKVVTPKNNHK